MKKLLLAFTALVVAVPAYAQAPAQPERASGRANQTAVESAGGLVVSANPLATRAGAEILRAGGSAIDAMVAMQLTLGLVEPQSSGLGGGAFLVYWNAQTRALTTYDAREIAPQAATGNRFTNEQGQPLPFAQAVVGGIATGIPGVPLLLDTVHRAHGRLPWARMIRPAMQLAEQGFQVSPRLATLIAADPHIRNDQRVRAYFSRPDGTPLQAGDTLRNPDYARTLNLYMLMGPAPFYSGVIAHAIMAEVNRAPRPGGLTLEDFAAYRVVERPAVCGPYRAYRVCGMGPPSSGGVTVIQMLGLLERFNLGDEPNADAMHLFTQANRLAFADRNQYLADPDLVPQPLAGLIDRAYLAQRSQLISPDADRPANPGEPAGRQGRLSPDNDSERPATSHLIAIDRAGNIVTMTTTIEDGFGARRMAAGFLLNNQLTDFSFAAEANGRPIANRVEPRKRPRSSMSPTIVFDQAGAPVIVAGSPGGALIIPYVAQTLVALIDWRMNPQAAVSLGHVANLNGQTVIEQGTDAEQFVDALRVLGHNVRTGEMVSGLSAVVRDGNRWIAGADPRREGLALGDQ